MNNDELMYKQKYLKYKQKYLELKQQGGMGFFKPKDQQASTPASTEEKKGMFSGLKAWKDEKVAAVKGKLDTMKLNSLKKEYHDSKQVCNSDIDTKLLKHNTESQNVLNNYTKQISDFPQTVETEVKNLEAAREKEIQELRIKTDKKIAELRSKRQNDLSDLNKKKEKDTKEREAKKLDLENSKAGCDSMTQP
jgi:hypothetical protein